MHAVVLKHTTKLSAGPWALSDTCWWPDARYTCCTWLHNTSETYTCSSLSRVPCGCRTRDHNTTVRTLRLLATWRCTLCPACLASRSSCSACRSPATLPNRPGPSGWAAWLSNLPEWSGGRRYWESPWQRRRISPWVGCPRPGMLASCASTSSAYTIRIGRGTCIPCTLDASLTVNTKQAEFQLIYLLLVTK